MSVQPREFRGLNVAAAGHMASDGHAEQSSTLPAANGMPADPQAVQKLHQMHWE